MKRLILLFVLVLLMQACHTYEDNSQYYINQPRDVDVVGVWKYDHGDGYGISYRKYDADGILYVGDDDSRSGVIRWNEVALHYWYTKNGIIYKYRFYNKWTADSKSANPYHFSEDKSLLYIMYTDTSQPWTRVILPE